MYAAIIAAFLLACALLFSKKYGKKKAVYFMIIVLLVSYLAGAVATISMIWVPPGWTKNFVQPVQGGDGHNLPPVKSKSVLGSLYEKEGGIPRNFQFQSEKFYEWVNKTEDKILMSAQVFTRPGTVARAIFYDRYVFKRFFVLTFLFLFLGYFAIVVKFRDTRIHRIFQTEKGIRRSQHDAHGSSRWSTDQEILQVLEPGGPGLILGAKDQKGRKAQPLALSLDEQKRQGLNSHIIVFGPPGSRKSRGYVIPNVMQANASYIVTDPSGEIYSTTAEYLRNQGYTVQVFNLDDPARSDQWNFKIENYNDAMDISNNVIKNTTPPRAGSGDPFWEKAEQSLIQSILLYMWRELRPEQVNFFNLLRLATMKPEQVDSLIEGLAEEHEARIAFSAFLGAPEMTRSGIVLSFSVRLSVFRAPDIAKMTARAAINLHDLGRKKTAVFVVIPEQKSTYEVISALFFTSAFQSILSVAKREGLGYPVHFILDEFANIGTVPDFQRLLATVRKYGVSVSIILQSINQLKAKYPEWGEWESIVGNCDNRVILGVNDVSSSEYFTKLLGKQTIETKYESRNDSVMLDAGNIGWREFGRELLQIDELSRLDMDNLILLQRGRFPALLKKYDYSLHQAAKLIRPANVFDYEPVQEELSTLTFPLEDGGAR